MSPAKKSQLTIFRLFKNQLDKRSFELLSLYLEKDLSQKEIAQQTNLSASVTRHLISKASFALRKASNDPEHQKAIEILYGHS